MSDLATRQLVDAAVLASILKVSVDAVNRMHRDGQLPAYRVGKKALRFNVDECLAKLRIGREAGEGQQ